MMYTSTRMWQYMRSLLLLTAALALPGAAVSYAQSAPPTLPDHTVYGRLGTGTGSGPGQAIPFTYLAGLFGAIPAFPANTTTFLRGDGNWSSTITGPWTFTPPANSIVQGFNISQSGPLSGSTTIQPPPGCTDGNTQIFYNFICINGEASNPIGTPTVQPPSTAALGLGLTTGGTNSQGTKVGLEVNFYHFTASAPSARRDHIAALFHADAFASDGGTNTGAGAEGTLFATSLEAFLASGATNHLVVSGGEVDVGIQTGASSAFRFGWSLVDAGNLQAVTPLQDAAIEIGATGPGWGTGILLSNGHGATPFGTSSCVICTDGSAVTIFNFMDISSYTVSGNIFKFNHSGSPAFIVDGLGDTTLQQLVVGNPTGGFKGGGTINVATNIYLNNTAYTNPDYALEDYFTGTIDRFANNPGAKDYHGLIPLDGLKDYLRGTLRLPGIDDKPAGVVERFDIALEKIEESWIYIMQLNDKIEQLKADNAALKRAAR